jgi:hypothetical protein
MNEWKDETITVNKNGVIMIDRGFMKFVAHCKYRDRYECSLDCPMVRTRAYDDRIFITLCNGIQYEVDT